MKNTLKEIRREVKQEHQQKEVKAKGAMVEACPEQEERLRAGLCEVYCPSALPVWSWQPACELTGSECFFRGSVISTNFL